MQNHSISPMNADQLYVSNTYLLENSRNIIKPTNTNYWWQAKAHHATEIKANDNEDDLNTNNNEDNTSK